MPRSRSNIKSFSRPVSMILKKITQYFPDSYVFVLNSSIFRTLIFATNMSQGKKNCVLFDVISQIRTRHCDQHSTRDGRYPYVHDFFSGDWQRLHQSSSRWRPRRSSFVHSSVDYDPTKCRKRESRSSDLSEDDQENRGHRSILHFERDSADKLAIRTGPTSRAEVRLNVMYA